MNHRYGTEAGWLLAPAFRKRNQGDGSFPKPMRAWVASIEPLRATSMSRPTTGTRTVSLFRRGFLFHLHTKYLCFKLRKKGVQPFLVTSLSLISMRDTMLQCVACNSYKEMIPHRPTESTTTGASILEKNPLKQGWLYP